MRRALRRKATPRETRAARPTMAKAARTPVVSVPMVLSPATVSVGGGVGEAAGEAAGAVVAAREPTANTL